MSDVRHLLKKQKQARSAQVNHPFAKYEQNRLKCVVCNSQVKNEQAWPVHLGSSQHRQNIEKLKALKQQQQQKRPAPEPEQDQSTKKAKLVNFSEEEEEEEEEEESGLPADFFDNEPMEEDIEKEEDMPVEEVAPNTIPAGFFDDPELEAKTQQAANEQAKLELEKNLADFHETMIEVTTETKQIEDEDDETLYINRNQDMFEEQALLDARVEKLKQMRQTKTAKGGSSVRHLFTQKETKAATSMFDDESSDEE